MTSRSGAFAQCGLDQAAHDFHPPVLQGLRVEIAFDRDLVRRERRTGKSARVQDSIGRQAARLDRLRDRTGTLGGTRLRAEAQQAREQRRQRAARLDLAEVEHLHAMAVGALRARGFRKRLEQARLADPASPRVTIVRRGASRCSARAARS
jgi:hypothetical protein